MREKTYKHTQIYAHKIIRNIYIPVNSGLAMLSSQIQSIKSEYVQVMRCQRCNNTSGSHEMTLIAKDASCVSIKILAISCVVTVEVPVRLAPFSIHDTKPGIDKGYREDARCAT